MPVANDRCTRVDHALDRFKRSLGAAFLNEPDNCIDDDDSEHNCGIHGVADRGGKCGCGK